MAERQKAKPVAFGSKSVTPITVSADGTAGSTYQAVIESIAPSLQAEKTELRAADGSVNGLIYKNRTTTLSIELYVAEATIAASEAKQQEAITVGDVVTFDNTDIPEIDDATHKFIVERVSKMSTFGEVRKIGLDLIEYENDLSAELIGE